jgi:hypothetical protein
VWHEGPARPLHRPRDAAEQQDYDRGKKTCHTRNTLRVIEETCQMGFVRATDEGKANEKSLAELEG